MLFGIREIIMDKTNNFAVLEFWGCLPSVAEVAFLHGREIKKQPAKCSGSPFTLLLWRVDTI